MEWTSGNFQQRQKRLEDLSASRLADVFFTLHVAGVEEPVYVSEVVEKTMDPTFRHIDLGGCGAGVERAESLTVRIWVKSERMEAYRILVKLSLNLRSLQFIGKDLAAFSHPFPQNCIIFNLTDGYYTCFTDAQVEEPLNPFTVQPVKSSSTRILPTASFDALLRLSKLDDSIQDALALRDRLRGGLESIAGQNRKAWEQKTEVAEREDYVKTIEYAKATVGETGSQPAQDQGAEAD